VSWLDSLMGLESEPVMLVSEAPTAAAHAHAAVVEVRPAVVEPACYVERVSSDTTCFVEEAE
jgi:hypothetical protein